MAMTKRATSFDPVARARHNRDRRANTPQLLAERAAQTPDEVFAYLGDDELTYAALHARVLHWAAVFQAQGVKAGDHVFTFATPDFDGYAIWLGLAWLGAVEVPINPAHRGPVLAHAMRMSDARLALVSAAFLERVRDVYDDAPGFETVLVLGADDAPLSDESRFTLLRESDAFAAAGPLDRSSLIEPQPHHIACIIFTSGTTGPAKAVLVPWGQIIAQTYLGRTDMENEDRFNMNEDSVFYAFFPTFHMSGRYALALSLARGARMAFRQIFSVENFWTDVDRYGCTHAQLLAPMMAFLMTKPESPEDRQHSLACVSGGPVGEVMNRFMRRYDVRVRTGFGMTEIGGPIGTAWLSPDEPPASCGVAVVGAPGIELRIVDAHDNPVPAGSSGELIVRAADPWTLNAGYYKNAEATAEAWRNGWFHTGDVMLVDERGEYQFVDRAKDCIRRRGENISSFEVESYAAQHPALLEVAAVPHPSDYGHGEDEVKLWATARPGATPDPAEVHAWLAGRMPAYMVPRFIEIAASLPKTEATQRVQKHALRDSGNSDITWDARTA